MVRILILIFVLFVFIGFCSSDQHIGLLMCEKQCSEIQDCFMITYYQQTLVCKKQGRGNVVKNSSNVIMIQVKYKGCGLEHSCGVGSSSVKNRRNACVCLQNSALDEAIMLSSKADVISTRNKFNKQRQVEDHAKLLKDLKGREFNNQSRSNLTTIEKLKMRENQNTTEQIHMRINPHVNKEENHNQLLKHNSKTIGPMNITENRKEELNRKIIDQILSGNKTKKVRHMKMTMEKKTSHGVKNQSNDEVKKKLNPKTMDHMNMSKNNSKESKRKAKAIMDQMKITKGLSINLSGEYNLKMKSKPRPLQQVDMEKERADRPAQSPIMKGKKSNYTGPMGQTPKTKHQGKESNAKMGPNPRTGDQIYTQTDEVGNKLRDLLHSRRIRKNNNMRPDFKIRGQMDMGRNEDINNRKPNHIPKDQRHTRRHGDDNQIRKQTRDQMYARIDKENTQLRNNSFQGENGDDMPIESMQDNNKMRQAQRRDLVNSRRQEDNINLKQNLSTRDQGDQRYTRRNGDGGNKQMRARTRDQIYVRTNEDKKMRPNLRTRDQTYRGQNEDHQMRPNPRSSDQIYRDRNEGNNMRPNPKSSDKVYKGRNEGNNMRLNQKSGDQIYRGRNEDNQMRQNPRTRDQTYRGRKEENQMRLNQRTRDQTYRGRNEDNQIRRNPRTRDQTYWGRKEDNQMIQNPRSGDQTYRGRKVDNQMRPNPKTRDQTYRGRNEDNNLRRRARDQMNMYDANMGDQRRVMNVQNDQYWRSNSGSRTMMISRRREEQTEEESDCGTMNPFLPLCHIVDVGSKLLG